MWAACRNLAPKLNIGAETLRKWVTQAQANAGERTGPTSEELEEIKRLKRENRHLPRRTHDRRVRPETPFKGQTRVRHYGVNA